MLAKSVYAGLTLIGALVLVGCDDVGDAVTGSGGGNIDVTGRWSGTITSDVVADTGQLSAQFQQQRNTVTGVISIGNSTCLAGGTVNGTVTGRRITLTLTDTTGAAVTLSGSGDRDTLRGLFSAQGGTDCSANSGEWTLNRQ